VLDAKKHIEQLKSLPSLAEECLSVPYLRQFELTAAKYRDKKKFIFLGRQTMYPIALEAALKLKEISYLDAQGYAAGEFKHGPLALIDKDCVCVYFATQDELVEKNISNIQEIKARGGLVIIVKQKKQDFPSELYDSVIEIPNCSSLVQPVLSIIPLQYFAMFIALMLELDVDKPRNLAKSVTVE
jgi:glucosamine--fructose-6-phosphate aminotransferase (isomerizing)